MLSEGNGTAQQCIQNLLSMARGECPYERCKGISPDLIDMPAGEAAGLLAEDVAWLIDNYEPRVSRSSIGFIMRDLMEGTGQISADIEVEEDE